jgi:uncharacterized membrane protein YeaQ/YmgE (transglycosylase-associated protein family)
MNVVWMLTIGLVVGWSTRSIMPGRDPGGIVTTLTLGAGGSMVAGFTGSALGAYNQGDCAGYVVSTVGAMLVLLAYRLFGRRLPSRVRRI